MSPLLSTFLLLSTHADAAPAVASDVAPVATEAAPAKPAPNPRAQTDFTAYTLEWGEARIGIGGIGLGVLPRTQVTTMPLLFAVGAPNVGVKLNAVRVGPLDLAASGAWGAVQEEGFQASYLGVGGDASLRILPAWSVHAGGQWTEARAAGTPRFEALSSLFGTQAGLLSTALPTLTLDGYARGVTARVATDIRFSRRDSLVLQGQALLWSELDVPRVVEAVVGDHDGFVPITDAYTASVAWQLSWTNVDARVGVGLSSVPGAWLLNTVDLAWRFGGPTRAAARKALKPVQPPAAGTRTAATAEAHAG